MSNLSPCKHAPARCRVDFDDREWIRSRGTAPRGRGSWAFSIEGGPAGEVYFSPSMTLAAARTWFRAKVRTELAPAGYTAPVVAKVLP